MFWYWTNKYHGTVKCTYKAEGIIITLIAEKVICFKTNMLHYNSNNPGNQRLN